MRWRTALLAIPGLIGALVPVALGAATPGASVAPAGGGTVAVYRAIRLNGSFEPGVGLAGWIGSGATLSLARDGIVGATAARVVNGNSDTYAITPSPVPVASTPKGAVYSASTWLRSDTPGRRVCLRIREWSAGRVVANRSSCTTATRAWKKLAPALHAPAPSRKLDVYVFQAPAQPGDSFEIDGLTLGFAVQGTSTDLGGFTTPTTSTTAPAPVPVPTTTLSGGGGGGAVTTTTTASVPTTTTTATSPVTTTTATPAPAAGCSLYAGPGGSDSAAGSAGAPFGTAQRLANALAPGQTGCLQAGTYKEDLRLSRGGTQAAPVTIRSADNAHRATIVGRMFVTRDATDVVIRDLNLNGKNAGNLPSPTVDSARISFVNNDVTNDNTTICFVLGNETYGTAVDVVIDGNRIHNCGPLPSRNTAHGIYVELARNTRIVNNYIYDNVDRGVQLYPDAQNTTVAYNVIDGNGEGVIFSGEGAAASNDNHVYRNVISNSLIRFNVESYWGGAIGTNNLADQNCLWNGRNGNVDQQIGFTATNNLVADPMFVDRAGKDFRLKAGSPCAAYGPQG
jgi:parallel beta-helix repeat protein